MATCLKSTKRCMSNNYTGKIRQHSDTKKRALLQKERTETKKEKKFRSSNFEILAELHTNLLEHADKQTQRSAGRWYKEKITCYGVKTPVVRRIAKTHFKKIQDFGKTRILKLSEKLLQTDYNEDATVAIQWTGAFANEFTKKDFAVFEEWLKKYINNWGKDDDFCLHILHPLIARHPELISKIKRWTVSKNMWQRRASAVCFITTKDGFYATKHNLDDIFWVAKKLMRDPEDLVQKGYGWMLKATLVRNPRAVFNFVMEHRANMARTALRYAIEKMSQNLRKRAMK